jgi:hypothetical protein
MSVATNRTKLTLRRAYAAIDSLRHPYTFVSSHCTGYVAGLGNKLFVLAAAGVYARQNGFELVAQQTKRWGIALNGADHESGKNFSNSRLPSSLAELLPRIRFESDGFIHARCLGELNDAGLSYDRGDILPLPRRRNVEFLGAFLNPAYFIEERSYICDLFTFPDSVHQHVQQRYGAWLERKPVGIHVRRGDRAQSARHELSEYYAKAIRAFPAGTEFVVISDDPLYCREELFPRLIGDLSCVNFVTGEQQFVDLLVYSRCAAHILADSTFSWWGAFLSPEYPRNTVICPPTCWLTLPHWRKLSCAAEPSEPRAAATLPSA